MVLHMARPVRHPTTGIFQFRRRVPADLRTVLGKSEEKFSLQTRDAAEARIAHAKVSAEIEARWQGLRRGVQAVSHKQAVAIAGEFYRRLIAQHEDNPGAPEQVARQVFWDKVAAADPGLTIISGGRSEVTNALMAKLRGRHRAEVAGFLEEQGALVDDESFERILAAVNVAAVQGREQLHRNASGDYRADPAADRFPEWRPISPTAAKASEAIGSKGRTAEGFLLVNIFERYSTEAGHAPSTVKRWAPIIRKVAKEVPDIRDLSDVWCVGWKDRLVKSGLSPASINDAYLASLRGTCSWAKDNKLIATNPVDGISVRVPKAIRTRPKGFTAAEAATILRATLAPVTQRLSVEHLAARRWIPWVCAYSGARVGEIGQLRGTDVQLHDDVWLMWVTPEAGSVKNGCARFVAIHPHLVEQGFVEFARRAGGGPMFYAPSRKRNGTEANPLHKKAGERVAKWVREIGIDDVRLQPNHGWRHRFKTVARTVDMDPGVRDYLQGHVPNTEGESYGDFEPSVLLREILKLPRYELEGGL